MSASGINPAGRSAPRFRGSPSQAVDKAGEFLGHGLNRLRIPSMGAEKAVQLRLGPLLPMVLTATALLYHQGSQVAQGNGRGDWKRMLGESTLLYALVSFTGGIMPLLGLGLVAYQSGQKPTLQEKAQVAVNIATTMLLGWAGVHLGSGMSEAANIREEVQLRKLLETLDQAHTVKGGGRRATLLSQLLREQPDEVATPLRKAIAHLRDDLAYKKNIKAEGASWKEIRQASSVLAKSKSEVFHHLGRVEEEAVRKVGNKELTKGVGALRHVLAESQQWYVRLARTLNPIFGYVIAGLMAGVPVANWVNRKINERYPNLKSMKFNDLFDQKISLLPGLFGGNGAHGAAAPEAGHGAAPPALGQAPGLNNHGMGFNGPSLTLPDLNGGQPMH